MKYVIFGGTGTLGHAAAKLLADEDVTIISRCELRQKMMKQLYPCFRFLLGDVTRPDGFSIWPKKADVVLNFAAQKHVDLAEQNQFWAAQVNYQGAVNVTNYAEQIGARYHVFTSTDKAVLPINTYGMSKGLAERYILSRNGLSDTKHAVFRWGNILGSRGSVLHQFVESLRLRREVAVTDRRMTRFWAHIDDIAAFMLERYRTAMTDDAEVPPMKASPVTDLVDAVAAYLEVTDYKIIDVGIRAGEKIHECLKTGHDYCLRSDNAEQYTKEELVTLVGRSLCA